MTNSKNLSNNKFDSLNAVMIDNYDSFTYNLVQYLREIGLSNLCIIRNDKVSITELFDGKPDVIFISPGPSTPDNAGISLNLFAKASETKTPVFGVCLGLQCLAQYFGAKIVKFSPPKHGKTSQINHDQKTIFKEIPSPFNSTRYHSLVIDPKTLPDCLDVTAKTEDNYIMAVRHKSLPFEGVQFHPEAVLTEHGHKILLNFLECYLPT